jgi:hypothetical protein
MNFFLKMELQSAQFFPVDIPVNIWSTSTIHYTEIFITFWKYDTGCPWSPFSNL